MSEFVKRVFISAEVEDFRTYLINMYYRSVALGLNYATYNGIDYTYDERRDYLSIIHLNIKLNNSKLEIPLGFDYIAIENIPEFDIQLVLEWNDLKIIDLGSVCDMVYFPFTRFENLKEVIALYIKRFSDYAFIACENLTTLFINSDCLIEEYAFKDSNITYLKVDDRVYKDSSAKYMMDLIKHKSSKGRN